MRLRLTAAMAATMMLAGAPAMAQDVRIRDRQRVVIPNEVMDEIRRLIDATVGHDLGLEIGREIGHGLRSLGREFEWLGSGLAEGASWQMRDFKAEQTDRQTHRLAIGATGDLELKNVVGDITVTAGAGREAIVEVVRVSRGRTDADAKLGLERVTVDVVARSERGSVTVRYPEERRPPYAVSVSYRVTAPAGTRLTIASVTGDVSVTKVRGEMTVGSTTGDVTISGAARVNTAKTVSGTVTLTGIDSDGHIEAGAVSGKVVLRNVRARRLSVSIVSGEISARDTTAEHVTANSMSGDIEFAGPVAPQGRYEFKAHSGSVYLGLTGGFDLEARTFAGRVDADASLDLSNVSRQRTSLTATAGKGGGVVVASTFSGHVVVGRTLR